MVDNCPSRAFLRSLNSTLSRGPNQSEAQFAKLQRLVAKKAAEERKAWAAHHAADLEDGE